jgi:anti-sigma B factor antagonist
VGYIDSSGVATLVEGLRSARKHGKTFILVAPSRAVLQVLELTRLDQVFEVRTTS